MKKTYHYRPTAGIETYGQGMIADEGTGRSVAVVYDGKTDGALLAAAPDLLDALQRIVNHLELDQSFAGDHALELDEPGHAEQCPVCMARSAIQKATGEA